MWFKHPFFKYITGTILILLCILLAGKIDYFLHPFQRLIMVLFFPIIIAGLLYYILRPVVDVLSKPKYIPRTVAILIVYGLIIGCFSLFIYLTGGKIVNQVKQITEQLPKNIENTVDQTKELIEQNNFGMVSVEGLKQKAIAFLSHLTQSISNNLMDIVGAITSTATVLVVVPFILFYFLKDGRRLLPFLLKLIPDKHKEEAKTILSDIDRTLAAYILGQMTVALVDGILMYIGYLIIGLDYALVLALFVILTAIIPLLGPALGILPAIMVALIQDPVMVIYILVILLIVQQLEGNLISPAIFGNRLHLHPLTIILLLIAAGAIYGFVGILIAIPLYALSKVTIKNFYRIYRLRRAEHNRE